ncbi:serine hydrolase [Maribacter sp. 2307UL18-2]|uniref:serine hydrolase n=1 Tax=Maribacter sp. 2307UL18-2 TaxID=3386274 RepID=UPI0039BC9433
MNYKKYTLLLFALINLVSSFTFFVISQSSIKTFEVDGQLIDIRKLNKQIEKILDETDVPGLSFAVFDEGQIVFHNSYGYKKYETSKNGLQVGDERVNKRTVFEACSMSKSFLVFAVHRLVDQGVLDLDKPLYDYLSYPRLEHDKRYKLITSRMVLTHSSGLENWQFYNNPDTLEILTEPGLEYNYSGEGYIYLSLVLQEILGKNIEIYMKNLVYKPLNLKNTFTTYSQNGRKPKNYSYGHNAFKKSLPKEKNTYPEVASMISTTARDYGKLLIGIFGGNYLSKDRMNNLTQTGIKLGEDTGLGEKFYYGPGFQILYTKRDTVLYQRGDNDGFRGFGFYSLSKKSGYTMFANSDSGDKILKILDDITLKYDLFGSKNQYPNLEFTILNVYNEEGYLAALTKLRSVILDTNYKVETNNLESLGKLFLFQDPKLSEQIAIEYMKLHPKSIGAIVLFGRSKMEDHRFEEAIEEFKKAKELDKSNSSNIDKLITRCYELLN